jgi:hypothetical protein
MSTAHLGCQRFVQPCPCGHTSVYVLDRPGAEVVEYP